MNETQGISLGIKKISDELTNIITETFFAYYLHSLRNYSYDYLKNNIHKKEYITGIHIVLETTIDPKLNTGDAFIWLSNFTKILIDK